MSEPIPMILWCPKCCARHVDSGAFATKPHHTHACQECGMVWRPAIVDTVGVRFLPGFKDAAPPTVGAAPTEPMHHDSRGNVRHPASECEERGCLAGGFTLIDTREPRGITLDTPKPETCRCALWALTGEFAVCPVHDPVRGGR